MRRLLWITPIAPSYDAGGGGEIRQAHLLHALADEFEITLLTSVPLQDERVRARVSRVWEVEVHALADPPGRTRRRLRDLEWALLRREPDEVARQAPVRRALARAIPEIGDVDVVCVEYIGLAGLAPAQRRGMWALTLHNLTSEMARHSAALAPGARQRAMLSLEQRNARRLEHWAVDRYDLVVTPSPEDAGLLPGDVEVVPNGVDTERFRPSPPGAGSRVVFTGALHTLPNRDGILWFCEEIWPRVREAHPTAQLDVVGSRPPAAVRALAALPGVTIHADVPDVVGFLERASVAVVPLRIGTGSRLKALEAMAAGRAVVGTSIGLGGLAARDERECLVENDAGAFARAVVRCLRDRDQAARLGAAGRSLVEDNYGWPAIGAAYCTLLIRRLEGA